MELEKTDLLARAQQAREEILSVEARLTEARQSLERSCDAARANAASLEAKLGSARRALAEAETAVG